MSKHQKIRFIVHYVKPTAQLLFRIHFRKVDQHAGGKWLFMFEYGIEKCMDIIWVTAWFGSRAASVKHRQVMTNCIRIKERNTYDDEYTYMINLIEAKIWYTIDLLFKGFISTYVCMVGLDWGE